MAGPSPLLIGAAVAREAQETRREKQPLQAVGGRRGQPARRVAALEVEELQGMLTDVVRAELQRAMEPLGKDADARRLVGGNGCNGLLAGEAGDSDVPSSRTASKMSFMGGLGLTPQFGTLHGLMELSSNHDEPEPARAPDETHSPRVWQSVRTLKGMDSTGTPHLFKDDKPRLIEKLMSLHPRLEGNVKLWAGRWDWFVHDLREPVREGYLALLVESKVFEVFFSLIIVLNAAFMAGSMNYQVSHPTEGPTNFMRWAEATFLALYIIELSMKIVVHRLFFFWCPGMSWNVLDFLLVAYGIVDISLDYGSGGAGGNAPSWMRALRLFKMAKVLRMLRVIKCLKELHLIMACILGSLRSLGWSLVMMAVILYMFSLVFVQQAAAYLGEDPDPEIAVGLTESFGSVQASIVTLFKTIFGGDDWSGFYDLMRAVSPIADVLFLFFVAFSQIALLNILTGIFVESALKLAEPNYYEKADEHHAMEQEQATVLKDICAQWDLNESGTLSREEFAEMMKAPRVRKYLHYLGLHVPDTSTLFNMLGSLQDDGNVNIDKFVEGCMRLRGVAKGIDLNQLLFEVKSIGMGTHAEENTAKIRSDIHVIRQLVSCLVAQSNRPIGSSDITAFSRQTSFRNSNAGVATNGRRPHAVDEDRADCSVDGDASLASTPASAQHVQVSFWGPRPKRHGCLPLLP